TLQPPRSPACRYASWFSYNRSWRARGTEGLEIPSASSPLHPKAALPELIAADRPQQIDFPEFRPMHVGEVELAMHAMPHHETGKPDLATGPDDEIRIGQPGGIEIATYGLRGQCQDHFLKRQPGLGPVHQQRGYGVGNLLPAAVA